MFVMGAAVNSEAVKTGVLAHSKAVQGMDSNFAATLDHYTAMFFHRAHDCLCACFQDHGRARRVCQGECNRCQGGGRASCQRGGWPASQGAQRQLNGEKATKITFALER